MYFLCWFVVLFKLGWVLVVICDVESCICFIGYWVEYYKLFVFVLSVMLVGVVGVLYVL